MVDLAAMGYMQCPVSNDRNSLFRGALFGI